MHYCITLNLLNSHLFRGLPEVWATFVYVIAAETSVKGFYKNIILTLLQKHSIHSETTFS